MDCKQYQKQVSDYLNNKMDKKQLEYFINHVNSCKDCYEELEIMFTLSIGLMQLEEEEIDSYNFKLALKDKLSQDLKECVYYRMFYMYRNTIVALAYFFVLIGIMTQILSWL